MHECTAINEILLANMPVGKIRYKKTLLHYYNILNSFFFMHWYGSWNKRTQHDRSNLLNRNKNIEKIRQQFNESTNKVSFKTCNTAARKMNNKRETRNVASREQSFENLIYLGQYKKYLLRLRNDKMQLQI